MGGGWFLVVFRGGEESVGRVGCWWRWRVVWMDAETKLSIQEGGD